MNYCEYLRVVGRICRLLREKERVVVAIDGRCGAGKSTLAARLQRRLHCSVFHMDDFFLRPQQRTEERLAEPGGNVDRERFLEEVLRPVCAGEPLTFRPYVCARQALGQLIAAQPSRLTIIEGAYACHPALWDYYDLRVFLTVEVGEQMRRIEARNGPEKAQQFRERWIPLEEAYFSVFRIAERCDLRING